LPGWIVLSESAYALVRSNIIPDHLAVLHHESNSLELTNVAVRISGHGDQVSKFSGLNSAHTVLPTQHFCSICRDSAFVL